MDDEKWAGAFVALMVGLVGVLLALAGTDTSCLC